MGSIRIPASYCGVVGYKPTYGLVSRFGELPPTSSTVDHLGPLAKDVTDAATLLTVLAGPDSRDPTSIPCTPRDYAADLDRSIEGLHVGVPRNFFPDHAAPEVQAAVMRAIDMLVSLGAEVHEVRIPSLQHMPLMSGANWNESRSYLLQFARLGPSAFADQTIWERQIVGQFLRAADLAKLMQLRSLIRREFLAVMETVDVVATATTPSAAFPIDPHGLLAGAKPGENHVDITNLLTYPYNLVGMPAISLPCGFTPEGLPVGLMLAGRHWEDDVVLRTAYAYERVTAWAYAIPPFCSAETV
jgi:aspartyl-tRNA(Asn)/glutamyl-tRNA(Gln) amidotransferase subunit A